MAKLIHTMGVSQSQGQELVPEPGFLLLSLPGFSARISPILFLVRMFVVLYFCQYSVIPTLLALKEKVTKVTVLVYLHF